MCGRYSIYESVDHYLKELASEQLIINGCDLWPIERYNVAPSTRVEIIRPLADGLGVDKVRYGWSPFWAKGKRPDLINATASSSSRLPAIRSWTSMIESLWYWRRNMPGSG